MAKKRAIAYILDSVVISVIVGVLIFAFPIHLSTNKIQADIDNIWEKYNTGEVSKLDYYVELSRLEQDLDKAEAIEIVIDSIVIVIYFIVVPYLWKGMTLGKKVMGIRIVNLDGNKANLMKIVIRTLIMDGLLVSLLIIFGIYVIPDDFYLSFSSILLVLQVLTLIASYFMVKYRHDSFALDDILSKSKVIEID